MSNSILDQDKEHADFVETFLGRFAANTKVKRGTNKEFFAVASLPNHVYENVVKGTEKPERINWVSVKGWYKKWRKTYGDYYDFLKVASRGGLKKK